REKAGGRDQWRPLPVADCGEKRDRHEDEELGIPRGLASQSPRESGRTERDEHRIRKVRWKRRERKSGDRGRQGGEKRKRKVELVMWPDGLIGIDSREKKPGGRPALRKIRWPRPRFGFDQRKLRRDRGD